MATDKLLERIAADVGKPLAKHADPCYWAFEYRDRAEPYQTALHATRNCYRRIRDGADPVAELTELLRSVYGIEGNAIRRILDDLKKEKK